MTPLKVFLSNLSYLNFLPFTCFGSISIRSLRLRHGPYQEDGEKEKRKP